MPLAELVEQREFFFVTTGVNRNLDGNLLVLPDTQSQYEDLVRAVDVIVTKPGYGIVADVLAHRVPMLYTDRGNFPEYPHLVQALNDYATAEFIPQDELLDGKSSCSSSALAAQGAQLATSGLERCTGCRGENSHHAR